MANGAAREPSPVKGLSAHNQKNGNAKLSDRWAPASRRENGGHNAGLAWSAGARGHGHDHGRQKSLSDAFRTIRARNGSMSQNAHEIADALRAPVSPKLVVLCLLWYASSALTNTSSKSILMAFDKPATLTLVQFAFVSSLCILLAWLATLFPSLRTKIAVLKHPIRQPSRDVIMTTLPLAAFQIGGHLLSSTATAKIPVSLVHTIKGLSPLFTVLAYRIFYDIRYPQATYLSLVPLTVGVMLACSGKASYGGQLLGVIQALLATLIFVTQNIVSKKIFNEAAKAEAEAPGVQSKKLDKLNLLCYSSGMAFIVTMPIWFWSEGITLLRDLLHDGALDLSNNPLAMDHGRLTLEFIFNGVFHFSQNMLAFVLLSMVSPVTYSVASLIKRVFVIVLAIIWFRSPTTPVQAVGIALTFLGLYLYDRTSESNKADRKARMITQSRSGTPLLPLNENPSSAGGQNNMSLPGVRAHPYTEGFFGRVATSEDSKKADDNFGRDRSGRGNSGWVPCQ
ncbi:Putative transporter C83.11 [Tolypocladium paradoxum]|uniref:Transporter C83.11 n=1 Tax=Tolypocladium paradoxum TaxID=94208 RepID=A0A2S4L5T0_9HYPO|nr:Putative transporter C83.11 [Tolypocladium paradoxum]